MEAVALEGAEEVCGLRQGHPAMFDALVVLVEGDHIGARLFMTLIALHDARPSSSLARAEGFARVR